MGFAGKIDGDAVGRWDDMGRELVEVDHAASAKRNLEAIGDDLKNIVRLDEVNHLREMGKVVPILGPIVAAIGLPFAIAKEILDPVLMPLAVVKDAADAAVHGLLAAFQKR